MLHLGWWSSQVAVQTILLNTSVSLESVDCWVIFFPSPLRYHIWSHISRSQLTTSAPSKCPCPCLRKLYCCLKSNPRVKLIALPCHWLVFSNARKPHQQSSGEAFKVEQESEQADPHPRKPRLRYVHKRVVVSTPPCHPIAGVEHPLHSVLVATTQYM
jgi:hypothetical protein